LTYNSEIPLIIKDFNFSLIVWVKQVLKSEIVSVSHFLKGPLPEIIKNLKIRLIVIF